MIIGSESITDVRTFPFYFWKKKQRYFVMSLNMYNTETNMFLY